VGYYVLPILVGDRLGGRIEPRIDHARTRVEVLGLYSPVSCCVER